MWKIVGVAAGEARLTKTYDLSDLAKGTWTYVMRRDISRSAGGNWSVNPRGMGWIPSHVLGEDCAALLHDRDGRWRLTIPRGFEPGVSDGDARSWLAVTYVYESIRLSRKVRTIYEAPGRDGLG